MVFIPFSPFPLIAKPCGVKVLHGADCISPLFCRVWRAAWHSLSVFSSLKGAALSGLLFGVRIKHYLCCVSSAHLGLSKIKRWAGRCPRRSSNGRMSAQQKRWVNLNCQKINSPEEFAPRAGRLSAETETRLCNGTGGQPWLSLPPLITTAVLRRCKHSSLIPPQPGRSAEDISRVSTFKGGA